MKEKVIIIGAGMSGCFMGYCLAKKGYQIEIFEKRPDVRKHPYISGRSFNLTLYYRALQAMKISGIWESVKKIAVVARGNVPHYIQGVPRLDPFDATGEEVLYTVHRNQLNAVLLENLSTFSNIKVSFNTEVTEIDVKEKTVTTKNKNGKTQKIRAQIIIGTDGIHSSVRDVIQRKTNGTFSQVFENWGYKEVHIDRQMGKTLGLLTRATHTWPRDNSLLIAFPNPDDSFTLMFNLPLEGQGGFSELITAETIKKYIRNAFPDLTPLLPEIVSSFLKKPTGTFSTVRTNPWYYKDFLVLIGDSAHAVIPFYGQGVSAAFDDCITITNLLDEYKGNWSKVLPKYQKLRKANTDILAKLSKENFIELRDRSRSSYFVLKDKTDTLLHRIFPKLWHPPLYILVAHGTLPYAQAVRKSKRQEKITKWMGIEIMLRIASYPFEVLKKTKVL